MSQDMQRQVAVELVEGASAEERIALATWAETLLGIGRASDDVFTKARGALTATTDSRIIWPILRRLGDAIKRNAWDERDAQGKAVAVGATAFVAFFAGGIAALGALGSAVAVPMWIVFGGGDDFARLLIDEARGPTA